MGRPAKRKKDAAVPRKRLLAEAPPLPQPSQPVGRECVSVILVVVGVFLALCLWSYAAELRNAAEAYAQSVGAPGPRAAELHRPSYRANLMGPVGGITSHVLFSLFGWCSFGLVLWTMLLARSIWRGWSPTTSGSLSSFIIGSIASCALLVALSTIAAVLWGFPGGGAIGTQTGYVLVDWLNEGGTLLLMTAVALIALAYATGIGAAGIVLLIRGLTLIALELLIDAFRAVLTAVQSGLRWMLRAVRFVLGGIIIGLARAVRSLRRSRSDADADEAGGDEDDEEAGDEDDEADGAGSGEPRFLASLNRIRERRRLRREAALAREGSDDDEDDSEGDAATDGADDADSDGDEGGDEESDADDLPDRAHARRKLVNRARKTLRSRATRLTTDEEEDEDETDEPSAPIKITRHTESDSGDEGPRTGKLRKVKGLKRLAGKGSERSSSEKAVKGAPPADGGPGAVRFEIPPASLLSAPEQASKLGPRDAELRASSRRLEQTLQNFRIGGRVVEVHPGPVITLYEFEPAPGVKVQRVVALADDLALALKVASVRVYAPVPGKGTVGIEVPNQEREIVRLRDLIEYPGFQDPQHQLALALGKDTFGEPFIADLAKMPHLLIAGATGTGKSVCINSLLLSLLYRNTPEDLRLIMIDPKMLELSVYEDIPHLKAPVVTQAKRARGVLWWAVEEMERRYEQMKNAGVRNLASYNAVVDSGVKRGVTKKAGVIELRERDIVATAGTELSLGSGAPDSRAETGSRRAPRTVPTEKLPRIVIVVDELADLMLTVGREVEELLTRLAQKARAAGIHLILATQRPSVNVITGLIKANFPSRISFKVASRIDARTVLDTSGAEKLLGQGDMLFLSPGAGRPKRLHSPFVADSEVHQVTEWLRSQGSPDYDQHIQTMIEKLDQLDEGGEAGEMGSQDRDELFDQAVSLVVEKGFASTSMVQRAFRIGYNRAARILELMEREGVVGPADGAKPRPVLMGSRALEI